MAKKNLAFAALLCLVSGAGWFPRPAGSAQAQSPDCIRGDFASYHTESDTGDNATFTLSQDYPADLPATEAYPWLAVDIVDGAPADPRAYVQAMFDYGAEGNIDVDWAVENNGLRDWFHIPWMHYGPDGREFMHGLTHELDAKPRQLGQAQTRPSQTWAVSIINDRGAWSIGQVWCDPAKPDPSAVNPDPDEPNWFPDGSAQLKLLFVTSPDQQVPWLEGTFEWQGDVYVNDDSRRRKPVDPDDPNSSPPRTIKTVRLMQVDVAVRDSRLATGWAFGTFIYNGNSVGDTPWARLTPVGLQWGNDPGVTKAMIESGDREIRETWLNEEIRDQPGNHLGWGGRLAGPLDSAISSCMSCHMTAGVPAGPILPELAKGNGFQPPMPEERRLNWFQNVPAGVPFSDDQQWSLDYSLQLSIGLTRFHTANGNTEQLVVETFSPSRDLDAESPAAALGLTPDLDGSSFSALWAALIGVAVGAAFVPAMIYAHKRHQRSSNQAGAEGVP